MEKRSITDWLSEHKNVLTKSLLGISGVLATWYAAKSLPRKLFDLIVWTLTIKILWNAWFWANSALDYVPNFALYIFSLAKIAIETHTAQEVAGGIVAILVAGPFVLLMSCFFLYVAASMILEGVVELRSTLRNSRAEK